VQACGSADGKMVCTAGWLGATAEQESRGRCFWTIMRAVTIFTILLARRLACGSLY
jgi:hypothetical protein